MKKAVFLLLMINLNLLLFSQVSDIVSNVWANCDKPVRNQLNYIEDDGRLKISYLDDIEIIIHPFKKDMGQLIEIIKTGETLYSFSSKYTIHPFYLSGIYEMKLSNINSHTILLAAYREGAAGLSANMTFGVLINIESYTYQYLSTWGSVDKNFVDCDNDGMFEFVCVDYQELNNEQMLIAHVFSSDGSGLYIKNDSTEKNNFYVFSFNDSNIKTIDMRSFELETLKTPNVFD